MLFPWIDDERAALEQRVQQDKRNEDYALRHFLTLLDWLRVVLLQDTALLYAADPSCPLWGFPPFSSPNFATFALCSSTVIAEAEHKARMACENLPERFAQSFRSLTTSFMQDQRQYFDRVQAQLSNIEDSVTAARQMPSVADREHTRQGSRSLPGQGRQAPSASSRPFTPPLLPISPPCLALPSTSISLPTTPAPLSPLSGPSQSMRSASITINFGDSTTTAVVSEAPGTQVLPLTFSSPFHPGTIFAPSNAYSHPSGTNPHIKLEEELRGRYGDRRFNLHCPWRWDGTGLVPSYEFQKVATISDVWVEWTEGLNDHIPLRELHEKWSSRWRVGSQRMRTEFSRRKCITDVIMKLANRPKWDVFRALDFLKDSYSTYSPSSFAKYLSQNKRAGEAEVLAAAGNWLNNS